MTQDRPRYEFRVWREESEELPDGEVEARTDIYLVNPEVADRIVKLRDGALDVKWLLAVEGGLELWQPLEPRSFPLGGQGVGEALGLVRAVGAMPTGFLRPADLVAFLERGDSVTPLEVAKRRVRSTFDGCRAETAEAAVAGERLLTKALEHEDAEVLRAAVRAAGWERETNLNYLARLTAFSDVQPLAAMMSQRKP